MLGCVSGKAVWNQSDCRGECGGRGWGNDERELEEEAAEDGGGGSDAVEEIRDLDEAGKEGGADAGGGGGGTKGFLEARSISTSFFRLTQVCKFVLQWERYIDMSGTAFTVNSSRGFANTEIKKI